MPLGTFERRVPSPQTAVDVFSGRWASDMSGLLGVQNTGGADLFLNDPRPGWAAAAFGRGTGRLERMRVLELGPLEGGHSYQLEKLGAAHVTAVEADTDAYLRCLIVKETLGLQRCSFLLGDALEFLRSTTDRFDLVFCSALLYEVVDPVELIKACCAVTNRCFVWTHYYDPDAPGTPKGRTVQTVSVDGFQARTYVADVPPGGPSAWMERDAILDCFRHFGLEEINVIDDSPGHGNGPALAFTASRKWSESFVRLTTPQ